MSDSSLLHALAGAVAGGASLAITYPLYSRMVRQQVQQGPTANELIQSTVTLSSASYLSPTRLLQCLKSELSHQSLEKHFAGLGAALYAITIQSGVYYYFFQFFKNVHGVSTSPIGNILVGSEAGIATVMLTNPLWVINSRQLTGKHAAPTTQPTSLPQLTPPSTTSTDSKSITTVVLAPIAQESSSVTRRIARVASNEQLGLPVSPANLDARSPSPPAPVGSPPNPLLAPSFPTPSPSSSTSTSTSSKDNGASLADVSFFEAFRLLVLREGFSGIYSGVGPALALVSSPALQFASYEYLKAALIRFRTTHGRSVAHLSDIDYFLLGAASKIFATVITYPIQTLKSQLQKDGSPYHNYGWFSGFLKCIRDMATSPEGLSSFYRGLKAKILQTGLTSAFLFVFREHLIALLLRLTQLSAVAKIVK